MAPLKMDVRLKQAETELEALKNDLAAELSAMTRLHEFSTRLIASMELKDLLHEVLHATIKLQNADFGNIQLYDPQKQALTIVAQHGFKQDFLDYFSTVHVGGAACGLALQRRERVIIEDVHLDPAFEPHRHIAASAGFRAVQSTPLFSRKGAPLGMISTHFRVPHRPSERELRFTDLFARQATEAIERRQAEEALRESRQRMELAMHGAELGLWDLHIPTGHVTYNRRWAEMLGYAPEEIRPHTDSWRNLIHPDDLTRVTDLWNAHLSGRAALYQAEHRLRTKSGEWKWILSYGQILERDHDGKPLRAAGIHLDITERKQAEEAQHESEEQFRLFTFATNDMFWNWDMLSGEVTRSVGFTRALGYTTDEIVPDIGWWRERLHPDDRNRILSIYDTTLTRGRDTCTYEYRFRRRDGSYAIISDRVFILRDKNGAPTRALGAMADITERKEQEERLIASETLLRTVVESEPECVKLLAHDGRLLMMNRAGLDMIDAASLEDVAGRSVYPLISDEHREAFRALNEAVFSGISGTLEFEIIGLKGVRRYLSTHAVPLRSVQGEITAALGISRDITKRKETEAALRESEWRFRLMIGHANDAIFSINLEGEIQWASRQAAVMTGRTISQLIGQSIMTMLSAPSAQLVERRLSAVRRGDAVPSLVELEFQRADGTLIQTEANIANVVDGDQVVGRLVVARDITNRIWAEEQYRALYKQLEDSHMGLRRLSHSLIQVQESERRHLAREMHDEIGQTLTAAKLNIQQALQPAGLESRPHLQESIRILDSVLRQVRNLSLELRPSLLDDLGLIPTLEWLIERHKRSSEMAIDLVADPMNLRPDAEVELACYRIVQEAMTNAVRHSGAQRVTITVEPSDGGLLLLVKDDGAGFDVRSAISRASAGQSIGLLGMQERVALAGGSMTIRSSTGEGTEISARFPLGNVR